MQRYFYAFDSAAAARSAIRQLCNGGIAENSISIVSRHAVGRERFAESLRELLPSLGPGAILGAGVGAGVAVAALWIMAFDTASAALVLSMFLLAGGILGAWVATPVESIALQDGPRALYDEINSGRTLLVVDSERATEPLPAAAQLIWQCRRPMSAWRASDRPRAVTPRSAASAT
jgi:hypothetical protein